MQVIVFFFGLRRSDLPIFFIIWATIFVFIFFNSGSAFFLASFSSFIFSIIWTKIGWTNFGFGFIFFGGLGGFFFFTWIYFLKNVYNISYIIKIIKIFLSMTTIGLETTLHSINFLRFFNEAWNKLKALKSICEYF